MYVSPFVQVCIINYIPYYGCMHVYVCMYMMYPVSLMFC